MPEISPQDWLQYGAMGLLALVLIFGMVFILRVMRESSKNQGIMIQALQNNSAAMAGLTAVIQGMQAVIMGWRSHVATSQEEEKE